MPTIAALDYVNAFCRAAEQVMSEVLADNPVRGMPAFQMGPTIALQAVNVGIGVTGEMGGHVNFGMSEATALSVAGIMMGEEVRVLDAMAISALSELANMIAGAARTYLIQCGLNNDITPPSVLLGSDISGTWAQVRAMAVPLECKCGIVHVTVGIRAKE